MRSVATWRFVVACNAIAALAILSTFFVNCRGERAFAEEENALQISRYIVSEAGYHPGAETFAILHVLEWRRTHLAAFDGLSLTRMGLLYCSDFHGPIRFERTRQMRTLTSEQIPDDIERDVRRWLAGERPPSVCDGATDWATPAHVRAQGLTPMRCSIPTQNAFVRRVIR